MIILNNRSAYVYFDTVHPKFKHNIYRDEELLNNYINASKNYNDVVFDRTGILPKVFRTSYPFPLPLTHQYKEKSFESLCVERAKELISTNKKIHIWWSGGMDSTCALASVVSHLKNKDQLVIEMTHSSIVESGSLFEKYIRNNFNYNLEIIKSERHVPSDELSISGYVGNHIMGQGSTNQNYPFDQWELSWQNFIGKHPRMSEKAVEFISPVLQIYPKLETFFDFMRMYLMVFKWHQDIYQHGIKNFHHESFYDTIDFQQWALYSKELPYGNGLMKLPMKNIIKKVFPDQNYYKNKKTRASQLLLPEIKKWCFVLIDGTVVTNRGTIVK